MSGRLGRANLAANTNVDLYTVPANTLATANISLCNRTANPIAVRLAVRTGDITASCYIEYDVPIPGYGILERTGIVMSAGETVTLRASAAGISARAHGFEEAL